MGGGDDAAWFGDLEEGVLEPDLNAGQVEGVIAEFDGLTSEVSGDAVTVVLEGEGGGLVNLRWLRWRKAARSSSASTGRVAGAGSWRKRSRGDWPVSE